MLSVEIRGVIILALVVALLYLASGILLPFVLGAVLAYLLSPVVSWLDKFLPRALAVFVVVAVVVSSVVLAVVAAVPVVVEQVYNFAQNVPTKVTDFITHTALPLAQQYGVAVNGDELLALGQKYAADIGNLLVSAVKGLALSTVAIINTVMLLVITPVVLYYMLKDAVLLEGDLKRLMPAKHRSRAVQVVKRIDASLSRLLRGQMMVCVLLGSFYGLALHLFGLQLGLVIGLLTGLLSFIPFVGMALGTVTALIMAMFQFGFTDWVPYAWIAAIFVAGQILEGSFLQPKFAGHALGLHPIWVVFAVLAGGAIGGFLGVLIALPLAAVLRVLVHEFLTQGFDNIKERR